MKSKNYRALQPMFKYFGGKSRIAHKIVKRIPPHSTWVEPFAGGASVTLAKPPSRREVLSDKRADVVRFYRHVKTGMGIRIPAATKKIFKRIKAKPEADRTPGEFVRLQGSSFGGHGQTFADGSSNTGRLLNMRLSRYQERLKNTTILAGDYRSIISRFDSPRTAMYLDPPYPTDKVGYTDYGRPIPTVRQVKSAVQHLKAKVLISYPNLPTVRRAFAPPHWRTQRFRVHRPLSYYTGTPRTRTELLITNFKPEGIMG